ncbi:hypothetical protein BJV82DRAFT_276200 [Fennellomyces sp. T-0311]|nr:hypothetical protein BJV82DRAFT_276200 [Fennellomyces sp. T-0311]
MTPSNYALADLDTKSPDPSDLPIRPLRVQQLGFMAALHPDIILLIFSYLNQADCLTCMLVCRDWYYAIPQYAKSVWTTIDLDPSDAYIENLCRARCLGGHVKNVTLRYFASEYELTCILNKLLDWGCTKIKSLGK